MLVGTFGLEEGAAGVFSEFLDVETRRRPAHERRALHYVLN